MEVLDRAAAIQRLKGDEALFRKLIVSFGENTAGEILKLENAVNTQNQETVIELAAALAETSRNVGAEGTAHVASSIKAAGEAQDWAELDSLLVHLEMEFEWLRKILDEKICSGNL